MAHNRFFTNDMLDVLLDHQRWRVIGTRNPPEVTPTRDDQHAGWMVAHSHSHPHTEVMVVLAGQGRMGYQAKVYHFVPGTVFCFGPGESHDLEMPDWAPEAQMLWITLLGSRFLARITSFRHDLPHGAGCLGHLVMVEESGLVAGDLLDLILRPPAERPEARALQVRGALQLLIAAVIDRGDDPAEYRNEPLARQVVRTIREHLEETGGAGLTPAEIARMSGYSKSHFMKLFKQLTGLTLQAYLDRCRWQKVQELERLGWKRYQIAAALGFSSPASFSRWQRQQRAGKCQLATACLFPDDHVYDDDDNDDRPPVVRVTTI